MARQAINHGTTPGDNTGETHFAAFQKCNANFVELYNSATANADAAAAALSAANDKEADLGNPASDGQILSSDTLGNREWIDPPAGGAVDSVSGAAPVAVGGTASAPVISILPATTSAAGSMSATDKAKLDGVATGATANATDAQLRDRASHTGAQAISTVTDLQTALDDKEPAISNPAELGMVLTSTLAGVRSWVPRLGSNILTVGETGAYATVQVAITARTAAGYKKTTLASITDGAEANFAGQHREWTTTTDLSALVGRTVGMEVDGDIPLLVYVLNANTVMQLNPRISSSRTAQTIELFEVNPVVIYLLPGHTESASFSNNAPIYIPNGHFTTLFAHSGTTQINAWKNAGETWGAIIGGSEFCMDGLNISSRVAASGIYENVPAGYGLIRSAYPSNPVAAYSANIYLRNVSGIAGYQDAVYMAGPQGLFIDNCVMETEFDAIRYFEGRRLDVRNSKITAFHRQASNNTRCVALGISSPSIALPTDAKTDVNLIGNEFSAWIHTNGGVGTASTIALVATVQQMSSRSVVDIAHNKFKVDCDEALSFVGAEIVGVDTGTASGDTIVNFPAQFNVHDNQFDMRMDAADVTNVKLMKNRHASHPFVQWNNIAVPGSITNVDATNITAPTFL
jgi:hypothetical protein